MAGQRSAVLRQLGSDGKVLGVGRTAPSVSTKFKDIGRNRPRLFRRSIMIRFSIATGLFVAAVAGSLSAERAAVRSADEAAHVRATRAAQNDAIAARDMEKVAACWTDDVTITAGLGRLVQGRGEYRRALEAAPVVIYERVPERVEVSSNDKWPLAFETGTWTATPADSGAPNMRGRYAAHWVKAGDRWLIRAEVFVSLECSGPACERAAQPAATSSP